jgi:hypothetical protein
MDLPPQRPFPEARLLGPEDAAPDGTTVWIYEGMLERFTGDTARYAFQQRVAWPDEVSWERVRGLGLWVVERLSINGHVLVGLRGRPEGSPPEAARRITPEPAIEG